MPYITSLTLTTSSWKYILQLKFDIGVLLIVQPLEQANSRISVWLRKSDHSNDFRSVQIIEVGAFFFAGYAEINWGFALLIIGKTGHIFFNPSEFRHINRSNPVTSTDDGISEMGVHL